LNGLDTVYPVNWNNCVSEFIEKPYENYKNIIRSYQPFVVLVNSVYRKLENKTEEEIKQANMPLNYFLNKSIENNKANFENIHNNFYMDSKYVIVSDWLETYVTKEHYLLANYLEKLGWILIKLSALNIQYIRNRKCTVLCITYDDFDISKLKCDNVRLIYKIDDLYPFKNIRKLCIENADNIISPYKYLFKTPKIISMYPLINNVESKQIWYSAVNKFYENIEFNENPIEQIFVSGSISYVYPLREYINNSSSKNIARLKHPNYNNYTHNCINELFYRKLNEYLCCFTDASSYRYVLLKVFEICSVGSLLLVEDCIEEELNKLGMYNNIHCIMFNKSNIDEKIEWICDKKNRSIIDKIRKSGMDLVRKSHNTAVRALEIDEWHKKTRKH
jgi:hypothetical protein